MTTAPVCEWKKGVAEKTANMLSKNPRWINKGLKRDASSNLNESTEEYTGCPAAK